MSYPSQNPQSPQDPQNGRPGHDTPQPSSHAVPSYEGRNQPAQRHQPSYAAPQASSSPNDRYTPSQPDGEPGRATKDKGFFAALFDLSFKSFITIRFASILYIAGIVLLTLGWLIFTVMSFAADPGAGVVVFFGGLIGLFIYIVLFRLMLEFYVATVRTAQNTSILVERSGRL